ncbi:MAG TPA: hypothetical protein VKD72_23660 [Gemmataceae bacterium]|nr:hypothetical protein [Gemmataceae bacterium]
MSSPPATVVFVIPGKEQRRPGQQVHQGGKVAQGVIGRRHEGLLGSDGGAFSLPVLSFLGVEPGAVLGGSSPAEIHFGMTSVNTSSTPC